MSKYQPSMDASQLVSVINERPATTSLQIAEYFGKKHKHVLRDIEVLIGECPDNFTGPNFGLSEYTDSTGRKLPIYNVFFDGFMLLVMGYTGKKALAMKLAYIEAFNAMQTMLEKQITSFEKSMDMMLANPRQAISYLLGECDRKTRLNQSLVAENAKLQPKAALAETYLTSKNSITIKTFAMYLKETFPIEIGPNRLHTWLRNGGWLHKTGKNKYLPTQKAIERGFMQIGLISYLQRNGSTKSKLIAWGTSKGQQYFANILTRGILPGVRSIGEIRKPVNVEYLGLLP